MKLNSKSGATLAAAAATLFLAGAVVSTAQRPRNAATASASAANACKGQSACKGGANSCKGLNACKGPASRRPQKRPAEHWRQVRQVLIVVYRYTKARHVHAGPSIPS